MVNSEIGKKIYSYDSIINKYENVYNKKIDLTDNFNYNNDKNSKYIYHLTFIIIIIILFLILYFNLPKKKL